jgi:predicted nucleotidyltransferase
VTGSPSCVPDTGPFVRCRSDRRAANRRGGAIIRSVSTHARLREIADQYRLDVIYAFGSRAEEARQAVAGQTGRPETGKSDLDLGVLPESGVHLDAPSRADLAAALEGVFAPARVDLAILPEASPFLALDIVTGEVLFARDPDREAEYQLFVLRRAGDLAPFERERRAIVLEGGR